jgi:hypothetical protein
VADQKSEKNRFPQIPTTVWWGVRAILNRTPNTVFDERFLAIQLGVQEAAAKQYITELIAVGILNEDKKATPLALQWRLDSSYHDAVEKLLQNAYPQTLLDLAPHDKGDRQKAVSYFLHEGLGQGAAANKAATYFLIGARSPNEAPVRNSPKQKQTGSESTDIFPKPRAPKTDVHKRAAATAPRTRINSVGAESIPLNVNVQIHISADAGTDQIEAIFSAMKRYLNDSPAS